MTQPRNQASQRGTLAKRGFTLIELLTVMAVMSVVTTLGTTMFVKMTDAWFEAKALTELDAVAEDVFESMRADFANVISPALSGQNLVGIARDTATRENDRKDRMLDADDQIVIPVQTSGMGDGELSGAKIMYEILRAEDRFGSNQLVRVVAPLDDKGIPFAKPRSTLPVSDPERANIMRIRFEYLGNEDTGGPWPTEWNENYLPRAIRVNMTLVYPGRKNSPLQIARKAVFPIRVP